MAEISPELASTTTMTAALGFSDSVLTPSPSSESAFTVATTPSRGFDQSQALTNKEVQVKQIFLQIKEVLNYHQSVAAEIKKNMTSGLRDKDRQVAAEVVKYHILPPVSPGFFFLYQKPTRREKGPFCCKKVFAQIGLKQYINGHRAVVDTVRQMAIAGFLERISYESAYYDVLPQQAFYQQRASSSPAK